MRTFADILIKKSKKVMAIKYSLTLTEKAPKTIRMSKMRRNVLHLFSATAALALSLTVCAQTPDKPVFEEIPVPDYSAYILTPKAPKTPRINGARVYGQRPGAEFLFKIPASGERPMTFEAKGLPKGLKLDAETGIIRGVAKKAGTYHVTLKATNSLGSDEKPLRIEIGEKLLLTPPMGWSSWNCFGNTISQEHAMAMGKAILDLGLDQYGWSYVNLDDGWQYDRGGKYHAIMPNSKFPDMKGLADYLHENGLKFGIYSGPWTGTYAGHIGECCNNPEGKYWWVEQGICDKHHKLDRDKINRDSLMRFEPYRFEKEDARQWAEWGVDYMKYDWCPNDHYCLTQMYEALRATGRDIVYSISNSAPLTLAADLMEYAQLWRTTGDIRDNWKSVSDIAFNKQDVWGSYRRPGAWPDADMMVLGCVGWGKYEHAINPTKLTPDEQYTHMTMWCILSAPLILGCDLTRADDFLVSLLTNDEVIAVNQDELGLSPAKKYGDDTYATYVKCLSDGGIAVAMFNLSDQPKKIGFIPRSLGLYEDQQVRDLWRQKDLGKVPFRKRWETEVAPHGVSFLKLTPGSINGKPQGNYR